MLLLDIGHKDLELHYILSHTDLASNWERISEIRKFHQQSLKTLLETDLKFCQQENIEQHFWKIAFYNIIEILRKTMPAENCESRDQCKKIMLSLIEEGTTYFQSLLTLLEETYNVQLDTYLSSSVQTKGLGYVGLALVSAQKVFLFLGDLARYKEQVNETANYGKSRQSVSYNLAYYI